MYHNYSLQYRNIQNLTLPQYTVEIKYIVVVGEDNVLQNCTYFLVDSKYWYLLLNSNKMYSLCTDHNYT